MIEIPSQVARQVCAFVESLNSNPAFDIIKNARLRGAPNLEIRRELNIFIDKELEKRNLIFDPLIVKHLQTKYADSALQAYAS